MRDHPGSHRSARLADALSVGDSVVAVVPRFGSYSRRSFVNVRILLECVICHTNCGIVQSEMRALLGRLDTLSIEAPLARGFTFSFYTVV